ncbi:MAG: L-threonylcarbamoyladenylate synthase [Haloarculaceae archaeon]
MTDVEAAARALRAGDLVVYPTETVYGLGADATDPDAVERVFDLKGRSREKPVSLGVPDVETAREYTRPTEREVAFMREFLPGPVTVVVERGDSIPDVLTAGRDRVGVRVPDYDVALELYERTGVPVTATSANLSGTGSVCRVEAVSDEILAGVAAVVDAGETPGGRGSTVVDVSTGEIHRRGPEADAIENWLGDHG